MNRTTISRKAPAGLSGLEVSIEAIDLERRFARNAHRGSKSGPALIETKGRTPVILSCPHAVNHPRERKLKWADTYTGPLALQLAELTQAYALIYARTSKEDPNYDKEGPYKDRLAAMVRSSGARFILDIHGIGTSRPMELAIGTAQGRTLGPHKEILSAFVRALRSSGFSEIVIDQPGYYDASRPTTIAQYSWRQLGVPALQLEIRKDYRDPENAPKRYVQILRALQQAIIAIEPITLVKTTK